MEFLVIGDFDTAKLITVGSAAKTTIGTPGYMVKSPLFSFSYLLQAPEILAAKSIKEYTFSADSNQRCLFWSWTKYCVVWSWAMIMYELMTLKRPFEDVNMFQIKDLTMKGLNSISLPQEAEDLYQPFLTLWRSCLALAPSDRPSVIQVKEALIKMM